MCHVCLLMCLLVGKVGFGIEANSRCSLSECEFLWMYYWWEVIFGHEKMFACTAHTSIKRKPIVGWREKKSRCDKVITNGEWGDEEKGRVKTSVLSLEKRFNPTYPPGNRKCIHSDNARDFSSPIYEYIHAQATLPQSYKDIYTHIFHKFKYCF